MKNVCFQQIRVLSDHSSLLKMINSVDRSFGHDAAMFHVEQLVLRSSTSDR